MTPSRSLALASAFILLRALRYIGLVAMAILLVSTPAVVVCLVRGVSSPVLPLCVLLALVSVVLGCDLWRRGLSSMDYSVLLSGLEPSFCCTFGFGFGFVFGLFAGLGVREGFVVAREISQGPGYWRLVCADTSTDEVLGVARRVSYILPSRLAAPLWLSLASHRDSSVRLEALQALACASS